MRGRGETIYAFRHKATSQPDLKAVPAMARTPICAHGADKEVAPSAPTAQSPQDVAVWHTGVPRPGQAFNSGPPRVIAHAAIPPPAATANGAAQRPRCFTVAQMVMSARARTAASSPGSCAAVGRRRV